MRKKLLNNSKKVFLTILMVSIFATGWSQKLECFVLKLPEKRLDNVKKIAVLNFEGRGNKGDVLADYMVSYLLKEDRGIRSLSSGFLGLGAAKEGKTYMQGIKTNVYTVLERAQFDKILAEQKKTLSGVIDDNEAAEVGKLLGVDAIIVGSVSYTSVDKNTETAYKDKNGNAKVLRCTERKVTAEARMKIISISTGQVVGTTNNKATRTDTKCDEERSGLMPEGQIADQCFQEIALNLTDYFAPHFVYSKFAFEKIKADAFKDKAKDAAKFAEKGDINNAFKLYKAIYDADNYNPEAAYNVGILYEVVGNFVKAFECYDVAYQIVNKNSDYYDAYNRSKKGVELVKNLESIGVVLKEYTFEEGGSSTLAAKVTIKGSNKDRIEVYETMEAGSAVVAKIPGGTEVPIIEKAGDWYLIKLLGNKQGYIQKTKVK